MQPVREDEILDLTAYEKERAERRTRVIQLRHRRRIELGDHLSLVFENRETVLYQIQEMVRAERMVDALAIAHEVETYNELLPKPGELSATLFIEVSDVDHIRADLESFIGLDAGPHLWIEFGEAGRAMARFEAGHSEEGRIAAVHYVRFTLTGEQRTRFCDPGCGVEFVLDHPNHKARVLPTEVTRNELIQDLHD